MNCSIQGCSGEYEHAYVTHTVRHHGRVVVIDHVPAEVCSVCGDVLLEPETLRRIEQLLANLPKATQSAPLYEYAGAEQT
ncbi:MAG TPA: type II toxin-antitoxin system MqsA family antitoxin [Tepidisphaeraceae bacterium]|nr:type II toxin-antitoxin system MqsA family antitoxin [Tepidisphaeraceae bacterium]